MTKTWYVLRGDEEYGPFSSREIRSYAESGWLRERDHLRDARTLPWEPAHHLNGLSFAKPVSPDSFSDFDVTIPRQAIALHCLFQIVAPLLILDDLQLMILMASRDMAISPDASLWFEVNLGDSFNRSAQGDFSRVLFPEPYSLLSDLGILRANEHGQLVISAIGKHFADWSVRHGFKAEYFASSEGGWGKRPDNIFIATSLSVDDFLENDEKQLQVVKGLRSDNIAPNEAEVVRRPRNRVLVDEQGVFVSSQCYRVKDLFGSAESDLGGCEMASLKENKAWLIGETTYTVVLHGWGVCEYSPKLTHSDRAFVTRVVDAINIVIAERAGKE